MLVTSSIIPIVNESIGSLESKLLNTESISPGVVSFEDNPYLPPYTFIFNLDLDKASTTSKYKLSLDPASFSLSKTAIFLTVLE